MSWFSSSSSSSDEPSSKTSSSNQSTTTTLPSSFKEPIASTSNQADSIINDFSDEKNSLKNFNDGLRKRFDDEGLILSPINRFINKLSDWRDSLELPDPGTYEQVGREAKSVQLTNYIFDGARAELSKALSLSPAFNVTHSFNLGAQGGSGSMGATSPGTYSFGGMYATNKIFAQGTIDNEATLMGRFNYRWGGCDISKLQVQWPNSPSSPSVTQVEHERRGQDYSISVKAYNPNLGDFSGIFITQYLQSVHPRLSLGVESVWQKVPPMEDANLSYLMKWQSLRKDWISTLILQGQGVLQASYWQKLSDRIEASVDLQFLPHPSPRERKAVSTVGLKYDLRQATVRAQADSTGKVSMLLEQRVAPMFTFSVSGEIDHAKSQSKFGVGIQLESSPLDDNSLQGITPPNPPM